MHHISIKKWFRHIHLHDRRDSVMKMDQWAHSEMFWALVVLTMILATLALIAWWSNANSIAPLPEFYLKF